MGLNRLTNQLIALAALFPLIEALYEASAGRLPLNLSMPARTRIDS
jgi:hypothetical protein